MSKCGKGCMPECEYFTTGGCISPFNCPYRIEELSPNSATSVSSIYVQNLISENAVLKAENAELRARLDKAVELPSGDRVWFITEDEEGEESYIISKPTGCLTVDELYEIGKKYFTTREAAKKAVEELKWRNKND